MTSASLSGLTFVTVTFRAEDSLLRLQARSMARFLDPSAVERIIVIDNGSPALTPRAQRSLLSEYGSLAHRVEIGRADDLLALPTASGWMLQQVLKLAVSRTITTPWYVLLDTKNHFVRSTDISDFVSADGRARGGFHSYAAHPLLPRLRTTLAYLGLDDSLVDAYPPTSTPFVMSSDAARAVIADVGARTGRSFVEEFIAANLSEFFLYSGWLARRDGDWSKTFDGIAIQAPTVWGGDADGGGVRKVLDQVEEVNAPFFGVHRRAMSRLSRDAFADISRFWVERGLFASEGDARRFRSRAVRERLLAAARDRFRSLLDRRR